MDKFPLSWSTPHVHTWIDPDLPPIQRAPVSTIMGEQRRQMHPGHTYRCRDCGFELTIPDRFKVVVES